MASCLAEVPVLGHARARVFKVKDNLTLLDLFVIAKMHTKVSGLYAGEVHSVNAVEDLDGNLAHRGLAGWRREKKCKNGSAFS